MDRKFEVGDRIVCVTTGVVGLCLDFYTPTGCEEQTMVLTDDGRRYHAPTSEWVVTAKLDPRGYEGEEAANNEFLQPYDEYAAISVKNRDTSFLEDYKQSILEMVWSVFQRTEC